MKTTLLGTNKSHLKIGNGPQKETIVFQPSIFRDDLLVPRRVTNTNILFNLAMETMIFPEIMAGQPTPPGPRTPPRFIRV